MAIVYLTGTSLACGKRRLPDFVGGRPLLTELPGWLQANRHVASTGAVVGLSMALFCAELATITPAVRSRGSDTPVGPSQAMGPPGIGLAMGDARLASASGHAGPEARTRRGSATTRC